MKSAISSSLFTVFILVVIICALCFPAAASDQTVMPNNTSITFPDNGPSDPAEVSAFLDNIMPATLARYNVPGATVAVVKDGRLVVAKGYGYSNISGRIPVDADTTSFRIGSVTKLFTWTAVMQLADEGKVDLDADVNTYLVDMKMPDTYPGRPVTLRNLMTHTAGFEDSGLRMEGNDPKNLTSFRQYCKENIPARVFSPGKVTSYSNYGTTLAAVIVEDVSGMPFEEYLQTRILTPLGMDRTSIKEDLPPDLAAALSHGYTFAGNENTVTQDDIFVIGPAGAISAPAPDIAKFMIAHLRNGTYNNVSILSERASGLMHAQAFTNDPRVSGMCLGFYEQYYNGLRTIGHDGDTTEFHSRLTLIPEKQAGYFVSYNSVGGARARDEFFSAFMDHYYPAPQSPVPEADPANASGLQKYAGTYEMNRHNYARFEKVLAPPLQIGIRVSGSGTLLTTSGSELVETNPGVFVNADGTRPAKGDLVFHTAPDGTVDYFMSANIPVFVFDRIPWYATQGSLDNLRLAAGALLATVLIWPLLFLFRRTHGIPEPAGPKIAGIARWTAGSAALLLFGFVFYVVPALVGDPVLVLSYFTEQAVPFSLTLGTIVPVIAAILTLITAAFAVLAWKERYWTAINRVHYTIVIIALIAMLWWVNFWNLWVWCL